MWIALRILQMTNDTFEERPIDVHFVDVYFVQDAILFYIEYPKSSRAFFNEKYRIEYVIYNIWYLMRRN